MLFSLSLLCTVIFLLITLLRKLRQPYLIAYILAGIMLGPHVTSVFNDADVIARVGDAGIIFLMFFLGMETDIPDSRSALLQPLAAQGLKMVFSFAFALILGLLFSWTLMQMLLITVMLIFNSTAVVGEYLRKNKEIATTFGRVILNMLLLQDLLFTPVLTSFRIYLDAGIGGSKLPAALLSCIIAGGLLWAIRNRKLFNPSFLHALSKDHDLQVFAGMSLCLGFGMLAEAAGFTAAIGSFIAGLMIGRTASFQWLEHTLKPFRIFFVALFFVSVGLRLDLHFITAHPLLIFSGVMSILLINSFLGAIVFRLLGNNTLQSIRAGALLSQTGEFSLLALTLAADVGMIDAGFLKAAVAVTSVTLLVSTVWIKVLEMTAEKVKGLPAQS